MKYLSLAFPNRKCTFCVEYDKKRFDCIVLTSPGRNVPLAFETDRLACFLYRIGTKKRFISLRRNFDYSFEGDCSKLVIVTPTPKDVLIIEEDKERRIFNADLLWNYVVYDGDAFVGSLDRKCLGRADVDRL